MSQVCAPDADITLSSSSGRLFRVHRKNLETHSSAFASASAATAAQPEPEPEPVALTEPSDVLELVLQFMYPHPQPDLRALDFRTLAALAEAVEKYEVYSALAMCRSQMECVDKYQLLAKSFPRSPRRTGVLFARTRYRCSYTRYATATPTSQTRPRSRACAAASPRP
jgi:hypothetical protein